MNTSPFIALGVIAFLTPQRGWSELTNAPPEAVSEPPVDNWSFTTSVYGYIVPESKDYVNPNFTTDRGWVHLEVRYNYEALQTGSLWGGYNLSFGDKVVFDVTPMVGGVFGDSTGVASGCNLSLTYKRFSFSSQSEIVFYPNDSSDFFYTWTEMTYSPWDWLRAGLVIQRTKAYKSELDIQRGFLVGVSYKRADLSVFVFNLGWTDPTIVLAAAFSF